MLLAGDIGGTKTNLALFDRSYEPLQLKTYPSSSYPNLRSLLEEYLNETRPSQIEAACFAVAGPVIDGVCRATNLPWVVETSVLQKKLGVETVYLINDLEANAHAISILPETSLLPIYEGDRGAQGNRALISPGTGLGEAGMYWDGTKHHPFASEGGHCEFGPRTAQEIRLCEYLIATFGHGSYERLLSGPGIENIFRFLVEVERRPLPEQLSVPTATAKEISQLALEKQEPLCVETLRLFVSILGSEGANAVLKYLALGGLFLGGGIPPKILPMIRSPHFLEGFLDKGRFKELLQRVPIWLINDDKASLKGSAYYIEKQGEKKCQTINDSL